MEVNCIASRKIHKLLQHLNFMQSMKTYVILVVHGMKWRLLALLKGSNYYKDVGKVYNFRIQSEIGKLSIGELWKSCFEFQILESSRKLANGLLNLIFSCFVDKSCIYSTANI